MKIYRIEMSHVEEKIFRPETAQRLEGRRVLKWTELQFVPIAIAKLRKITAASTNVTSVAVFLPKMEKSLSKVSKIIFGNKGEI